MARPVQRAGTPSRPAVRNAPELRRRTSSIIDQVRQEASRLGLSLSRQEIEKILKYISVLQSHRQHGMPEGMRESDLLLTAFESEEALEDQPMARFALRGDIWKAIFVVQFIFSPKMIKLAQSADEADERWQGRVRKFQDASEAGLSSPDYFPLPDSIAQFKAKFDVGFSSMFKMYGETGSKSLFYKLGARLVGFYTKLREDFDGLHPDATSFQQAISSVRERVRQEASQLGISLIQEEVGKVLKYIYVIQCHKQRGVETSIVDMIVGFTSWERGGHLKHERMPYFARWEEIREAIGAMRFVLGTKMEHFSLSAVKAYLRWREREKQLRGRSTGELPENLKLLHGEFLGKFSPLFRRYWETGSKDLFQQLTARWTDFQTRLKGEYDRLDLIPATPQRRKRRVERTTQRPMNRRASPFRRMARRHSSRVNRNAHKRQHVATPPSRTPHRSARLKFLVHTFAAPSLDRRSSADMKMQLRSFDLASNMQQFSGHVVARQRSSSLAESAMKEDVARETIADEARSSLMTNQHRITSQTAGTMKPHSSDHINTPVVRPLIWSGMHAVTMAKQPAGRRSHRARTTSLVQPMQNAVAMPSAAVRGSCTTAGHEVFVQRGNGLRDQTSNASAALAIAGQHSGKHDRPTSVNASVRWHPTISMRGSGRMNPALAYPAPVIMQPIEHIDRPEIQINDRLYSIIDQIDPDIGEELLACIMEQLQQGPLSLADDDIRIRVNSLLPDNITRIDHDSWKALLQETLLIAFQNVAMFDKVGMRGRAVILADAALLLEIDPEFFAEWEECFAMDCIAESLAGYDVPSIRFVPERYEPLICAVQDQLGMRANGAFAASDYRDALPYSLETEIQWRAARLTAIPDSDRKVATAAVQIAKLAQKDKVAATRVFALIVQYSEVSRRCSTANAPVRRWSREDLRALVAHFAEGAPWILSSAHLRSQLSPWENKAFNKLIYSANYEHARRRLNRLDPKQPVERFLDLLEESGQRDEVLHDIWRDMARNFNNKLN